MVWSNGIARDYSKGLKDGKSGLPFNNNVDFPAAYAEGYLHGETVKRNRLR